MITLNQTPGNDNTAIWIIKISLDTSTIRLASKSITLSGNLYDGEKISTGSGRQFNHSLSSVTVDIPNLKGIGSYSQLTFGISNYNGLDKTDFFPYTSQPYITGRRVDYGIVWEGATTESQITWLWKGYIWRYAYTDASIDFTCVEYTDLDDTAVPYYSLQDSVDDGVSYYTNLPEENIGIPIPLIYGDFSLSTLVASSIDYQVPNEKTFAPILTADKLNNTFVIASHKLKEVSYQPYKTYLTGGSNNNITPDIYKYVQELQCYMNQYQYNSGTESFYQTVTNAIYRSSFNLGQLQTDYNIEADMSSWFKRINPGGIAFDIKTISNTDTAEYINLDQQEEMYPAFENSADKLPNFGNISTADSEIKFLVLANNPGLSTRTLELGTREPGSIVESVASFNISALSSSLCIKGVSLYANDDWTDLFNTIFRIQNKQVTGGEYIRIICAYIIVSRVAVEGLSKDFHLERGGYVNTSAFFFYPQWKKLKDYKMFTSSSVQDFSPQSQNISCKGRMFS